MSDAKSYKQRAYEAEADVLFLQGLLDCFWSGNVPMNASMDHYILAKWGRKRLEHKARTPVLVQKESE